MHFCAFGKQEIISCFFNCCKSTLLNLLLFFLVPEKDRDHITFFLDASGEKVLVHARRVLVPACRPRPSFIIVLSTLRNRIQSCFP